VLKLKKYLLLSALCLTLIHSQTHTISGGIITFLYAKYKELHCPILKLERERKACLEQSTAIKNKVFQEYKSGTLPHIGGVKHAEIDTISVVLMDSQAKSTEYKGWYDFSPIYIYRTDGIHDEQFESRVNPKFNEVQNSFFGCIADGVTHRDDPKNPVIFIAHNTLDNEVIEKHSSSMQTMIILHEWAHALDSCTRNSGKEQKECYSWLNADVKDNEKANLSEVHADKQATAWIKKYYPEEAQKLKQEYEQKIAAKQPHNDGFTGMGYADDALKLAWLRDSSI